MLRVLSWAGGSSEFLARPLARGRVHGLGRFTAPAHSAWFWPGLWAAAAAASFAALILSFVTGGRLVSTVDGVLVGMFFVGLFVLQFAVMLFLEHEDNLLVVVPDTEIANALTRIQRGPP